MEMESKTFDEWLAGLHPSFWGTAQHTIMPAQFFGWQANEGAGPAGLRSPEEAGYLARPFALHIPIAELSDRWQEVPAGRLVATFCSSVTRAVVPWVYPQLKGRDKAREQVPWYPSIYPERCDGCGDCLAFCAYDVYDWAEASHRAIVVDPFNCLVGCDACARVCERGAIRFPPREMLARMDR